MGVSPLSSAKEIKDFPLSGSPSDPLTSYSDLIERKTHLIMTQWKELKAIIIGLVLENCQRGHSALHCHSCWFLVLESNFLGTIMIIYYWWFSVEIFLSSFSHSFIFKNPLTSPILTCSFCWCRPASSSLFFHSVSLIIQQPHFGYWNPCICLLIH